MRYLNDACSPVHSISLMAIEIGVRDFCMMQSKQSIQEREEKKTQLLGFDYVIDCVYVQNNQLDS